MAWVIAVPSNMELGSSVASAKMLEVEAYVPI